ncbi:MAG: molybdopterin-guanine dinucleotide biosynthesis protein B [Thermoprotei archaeon]|nr:MAG: molybdopterin-guanine dinucleotide biosynthesis protein B [Thermoprotei archaeon]
MKAFAVIGFSKSGKTALIEHIVKELKSRSYSVATIKHVHGKKRIDLADKDTWRHVKAGSDLTIAISDSETLEVKPVKTELWKALWKLSKFDFVVLEGFKTEFYGVKIAVVRDLEEANDLLDPLVIAFTGKLAEEVKEINGIPVVRNIEAIIDLVEKKAFAPPAGLNCGRCKYGNCTELAIAILRGQAGVKDCLYITPEVKLIVNGSEVKLNSFTSSIFRNVIFGLISSLKGIDTPYEIKVEIKL